MESAEQHPLPLVIAAPGTHETDVLALPVFESDDFADLGGLDAATGGELTRAQGAGELSGKPFELFLTPIVHHWKARRVMLVGAGPRAACDAEQTRRVAAAAVQAARQRRMARLSYCCRPGAGAGGADAARLLQAVAEGLTLSQAEGPRYKRSPPDQERIADLRIIAPEWPSGSRTAGHAAVMRGRVLGECTNLARDLGNEPPNRLTPRIFVERAAAALSGTGLQIEVLDEHRLEALGMGLLLGVARGSAEPPRMLVIRHEPPGAPDSPVLGLVGKGVTFDTGGISIKPAEGMDRMKVDMAGGAAVVGAMRAAALLDAPVRMVGVIPSAENMPGGRALKPGDVLKGASGISIEVMNTDAEGRLILGDALWYAGELGATHLVDVATLTGACVVALGRFYAGLFGTPGAFVEAVRAIGELTGDRCWPLPVSDDYAEQLRSEVADFVNTGGRPAGAVTAAVFLKQFTGARPWAHLDIAGTAWVEDARPFMTKGASGAATRLLAELALAPEAWRSATAVK